MDVLITQKKMTDSEAFVKARGGGNLIGKAMYGGGKITMKQLYLQSFEVVFDAYFKPGLVERFFTRNGITLKPEIELCSHELLVDLAAIGLGVACVTREFARPALEAGTIRELRTVPEIPERSLSVCTLQDVAPSPAAEEFLRFWA